MDLWVFIMHFGLKFSAPVLILLLKLFQLWESFQLALLYIWHNTHHFVCVCVCVTLPYFLALEVVPSSSCKFLAPGIKSAIFPRRSSSFFGRMVLETKAWMLGVLAATGVSLFLGPTSCQSKDVCILTCVYISVYISIYRYVRIYFCKYFYK